jgi:hypothetical protein
MRQIDYPRSFFYVSCLGPDELSAKAADRPRWLKAWRALTRRGVSSQEAADALRLPRSTLYRWELRQKAEGLLGPEAHSRATVGTASGFLDRLQARMPFPGQGHPG